MTVRPHKDGHDFLQFSAVYILFYVSGSTSVSTSKIIVFEVNSLLLKIGK